MMNNNSKPYICSGCKSPTANESKKCGVCLAVELGEPKVTRTVTVSSRAKRTKNVGGPMTTGDKLRTAMWFLDKMGGIEQARKAIELAHSAMQGLDPVEAAGKDQKETPENS